MMGNQESFCSGRENKSSLYFILLVTSFFLVFRHERETKKYIYSLASAIPSALIENIASDSGRHGES
jgi:hypothetical protein